MQRIAAETKNLDLKTSSETAYKKGLELDLNEDFILLKEINQIGGSLFKAELWAEFEEDKVSARFKIFKNNEFLDELIYAIRK